MKLARCQFHQNAHLLKLARCQFHQDDHFTDATRAIAFLRTGMRSLLLIAPNTTTPYSRFPIPDSRFPTPHTPHPTP
ncbi:MAG: hypothetical protein F6K55_05475 [Moorea sp. SIO4A3]|nr:hypothetical protein [Moorena sp. SIO4A3]